jgi:hypothetical protein
MLIADIVLLVDVLAGMFQRGSAVLNAYVIIYFVAANLFIAAIEIWSNHK